MPGDVIRVVLADDHAVVRAGLKAVLSPAKDISVIAEATNGREAVALAERFNPDVVIMDLSMPDMDGASATKAILAKQTATLVLVLTVHADHDRYNALTQRERDVLRLVAQGYSAPEIGEQLFISPKTVDTYKQRINEKLGIAHRSEYVDFALKVGILGATNSPTRN